MLYAYVYKEAERPEIVYRIFLFEFFFIINENVLQILHSHSIIKYIQFQSFEFSNDWFRLGEKTTRETCRKKCFTK